MNQNPGSAPCIYSCLDRKTNMPRRTCLAAAAWLLALSACGGTAQPNASATPAAAPTQSPAKPAAAPMGNVLRMRIDGVPWQADNGVWGAVDPLGRQGSLLISGNFGHGREQQAFNLNLDGISGAGSYRVATEGIPDFGVAQMAGLSQTRFIAGGAMFPHEMQVEVLHAQAMPVQIKARFSGVMNTSDGSVLKIEDGLFQYAE